MMIELTDILAGVAAIQAQLRSSSDLEADQDCLALLHAMLGDWPQALKLARDASLQAAFRADQSRHYPEALPQPAAESAELEQRIHALRQLSQQKPQKAVAIVDRLSRQTDQQRTVIACDGIECERWRDLDDLLGDTLELFVDGRWVWVAASQWRRLQFLDEPVEIEDPVYLDRSDLVRRYVRPVRVELVTGEIWDSAVMPMLYAQTGNQTEDELRLGVATDCTAVPDGPIRGLGGRVWLFDDDEIPVAVVRTVEQYRPRLSLI
ncbi:type VI secretion system accessory protein TagJ [Tuwongella immobilis]|uniref:Uncharacterized protein n=1 Tax=Tuwongella immobilis TaxID=692036 RepID=A0A6C2YQF3_9BACT|nr:type VI secretion system accessory protein TagJ [Tuwongella immobilis]VIP03587.1 Virulence protein SciE type OS=Planctomyces brasiliensis (strain ATCC 49424 / DSM 5305 / JCM 21570 / NBRC 103401 / IFAM 1448) GN=Plabr_1738 PE=4 SV=1: ImpE [Tuwongella immobilis]VTS04542.1 Virulence protein SciE type OS=Planctomyces brasiliensis (strain ATCC 49424 / DSM 5305 / JCM 21570 / NBRC 103401 / IFAM 1448) GN=Plabr_1738 PE=4 SV=1: ImpE [Tuwongella immobilis]